MVSFEYLANSVKLDEPAESRSIFEIRGALAKTEELAQHPLFKDDPVFDAVEAEPWHLHRTTVMRMLLEIDTLPRLKGRIYTMTSQGIELSISNLDSAERLLNQALGSGHEYYLQAHLGGQLKGQLKYLLGIARHGVITTNKSAIEEHLDTIPNNAKKVT